VVGGKMFLYSGIPYVVRRNLCLVPISW